MTKHVENISTGKKWYVFADTAQHLWKNWITLSSPTENIQMEVMLHI
jgi:hypothetical protein